MAVAGKTSTKKYSHKKQIFSKNTKYGQVEILKLRACILYQKVHRTDRQSTQNIIPSLTLIVVDVAVFLVKLFRSIFLVDFISRFSFTIEVEDNITYLEEKRQNLKSVSRVVYARKKYCRNFCSVHYIMIIEENTFRC